MAGLRDIISKSKCNEQLKNNPNNMLALSWTAHQWFDGENTVETNGAKDIPVCAIEPPESRDNLSTQFMGEPSELRAQVEVIVKCFNKEFVIIWPNSTYENAVHECQILSGKCRCL